MRTNRVIIPRIYVLLVFLLVSLPGRGQEWQWDNIDRVVAIADIHGAYDSFEQLLLQAQLIDDGLDWAGNSTHLVIVGDVLDRGAGSRKALELIMKLETQAPAAGGQVHMVLGNHEVMNLSGDLNYVSVEEFASYAGDESQADRQAGLSRYRQDMADAGSSSAGLDNGFEKKFPTGFFGHRRTFSLTGRYGQWLAGKPVLVKINDTVFMHGGMSRQAHGTTGGELNRAYSELLHAYLEHWQSLADAGILPLETDFYDHAGRLEAFLENNIETGQLQGSAKRLLALNESPLLRTESVIWYRGNVLCNAVMAESELDTGLQDLDANHLVIGHTPTPSRRVLSRFDGKLLRADTGMLKPYYGGRPAAVVFEHGQVSVIYANETGTAVPEPQPRQVGLRPGQMSDAALEQLLTSATLTEVGQQHDGSRLVQLEYDGSTLDAVFTPALSTRRDRVVIPEVAAYRLDRLLGLDLVPVAVTRDLGGDPGALSLSQDQLISETGRQANRLGAGAWCPLPDQFNMMYIFDILAYNEGRSPEEIRYNRNNWQLVLTGNRKLFSTSRRKPRYLAKAPVNMPRLLAARLRQLDASQLAEHLGDVLDDRRRQAILARAELLLDPEK